MDVRHRQSNGSAKNRSESQQKYGLQRVQPTSKVTIVGAGLVGSMAACFLARRGYQVEMFEMRQDPRLQSQQAGNKSINLALSERGRSALRALGLEDIILEKYSIQMHSRMIHDLDGTTRAIPYGREGQCILSVGRRFLNELLLSEAEKYPNVSMLFNHKMKEADMEKGRIVFQNTEAQKKTDSGDSHGSSMPDREADADTLLPEVESVSDIILGCDGAHSAVRRNMIKLLLLNYSQKYIEHGYLELCIPATATGEFAMPENYLHIWPRGSFMMIALPNLDRSWTVTLFMPFERYEEITNETKLMQFFETYFPDSIPLLTREGIMKTFFARKPSPLISIKCSPYNYKDKVLLMGDAAHAMVPFYGQGMNCGFEDCFVMEDLLDRFGNDNLGYCLSKFTTERVANCHSIIDLAMYNYVEMRDLVNKRSFLLRKKFDGWMNSLFPNQWIPLYSMVTFSRMPYSSCVDNRNWQDHAISLGIKLISTLIGLYLFALFLLRN